MCGCKVCGVVGFAKSFGVLVCGCKVCGVVGFAKSSLRLQIMLSVGVCLQILWSCWFCKIKYMAANSVELLVLQNQVYGCKLC